MKDIQQLRHDLREGVIAFPVTPFHAKDWSLDLAGYRKNVEEMMDYPLAALVAAGGTGEMYSITPEEQVALVKATVEISGGKIPVIAGAGFGGGLSVVMAAEAEKHGADGILMFPPYYPGADFEGLLDYYKGIGKATKLGLLLYGRDWVNLTPGQVERAAAEIPNLAAFKDGQGKVRDYQRTIQRVGDRLNWIGGIGDDCVPGYYSIGIRTYTSSVATIALKLSIQIHERAAAQDQAGLLDLMNKYVLPLYDIRARRKGYEVTVMKEAMNILGKAGGVVRPPLPQLNPGEREEIAKLMKAYGPVL
ncbi:MAG: dihydrodipicolinate synthase family protein [Acidobacteria bacterium]|nr:dihydrodipicolinate synthase family protein [Acidobacteriota bacterium]